jgi:hypothetical protein
MNNRNFVLAAMSVCVTVVYTHAADPISIDFFHDSLEPYGDWREVGNYGYCWQPRDVDENWRPYRDGHWLYTDAGWTWDSEERYAWAVYHYGRWARLDQVGWVWVPGTEWGPAWVSWRRGPQHVGWAPLPPDAEFNRSVGFSARVDADYDIGPANYSFVEVRNFGAPQLRTVIVEPRQNITIIRETTNITRITYVNNVVYNEGPRYDVISRESAQPIRRLRLERRGSLDGGPGREREEQLRARVDGESFRVMALPFDTKPATAPRKVRAKVEKVDMDRGWKNAGSPDEVNTLRAKMKSEAETVAEPAPAKPGKTSKAPAALPVSSPAPGDKRKGRTTEAPTKPAAEVATPLAVEPKEPQGQARPGMGKNTAKPSKPSTPETGEAPPAPAVVNDAPPAGELKPRRSVPKTGKLPVVRPPANAEERPVVRPPAPAPEARREKTTATPPAPGGGKKARPGPEERPKPEPRQERKSPEARPAAGPDSTSPPSTPAGKEDGKGKGKKKPDETRS